MDNFGYISLLAFVAWMLFGIMYLYDQMRLFRAYQSDIDKDFELSPFNENFTIRNPITIIRERWRIAFGHYPKHPEVDRLAKRVRHETILFFTLFILFVVLDSMS